MGYRIQHDIDRFEKNEMFLDDMPDYVVAWYNNLKANNLTSSSCIDYLRKIKHFLYFVGDDIKNIKPTELTLDVTQKYMISIQTRIKDGKRIATSDSYKQCIWASLNSFYSFLVQQNIVVSNPMEFIKRSKNRDLDKINKSRKLLTADDFQKILAATDRVYYNRVSGIDFSVRDRCILMFFMSTGMRKTALTEIDVDDVDVANNIITIVDKGQKIQTYYLSSELKQCLIEWLNNRKQILLANSKQTDALFISANGERLTDASIYKMVRKYSEDALGYAISPHKLRSGFCSIMYEHTHDIEAVRRIVGHSNVATTQRYIVTKGEERKEAAEYIGSVIKV